MPIDNSDPKEVEQRKSKLNAIKDFMDRYTVTAASTANYVYRNPPVHIRYGQNGQRDVVVTEDENGIRREIPAPLEYRWANYGNPDGIGQAIDAHNDGNAREILNNEPIRIHWNEPGYVAQYQAIPNENQNYRQFRDAIDRYAEMQRTLPHNTTTFQPINFNEQRMEWPAYDNLTNGVTRTVTDFAAPTTGTIRVAQYGDAIIQFDANGIYEVEQPQEPTINDLAVQATTAGPQEQYLPVVEREGEGELD